MFFKKYLKNRLSKKREHIFSERIKDIKNKDVTILCNCCIGGCLYHDAKLKFQSPTINLYFEHHGFIDFVQNIDRYLGDGILLNTYEKEYADAGPIGILRCKELPDIRIHFLHYSDFETAKKKWIERSKRINPNKIFLVIEAKDCHEHELINEYLKLPYPSVIFTDLNGDGDKVLHMKHYDKKPNKPITSFVGFNGKKAMMILISLKIYLIIILKPHNNNMEGTKNAVKKNKKAL